MLLLSLILSIPYTVAENEGKINTGNGKNMMNLPSVYIDCEYCDMDFIKIEIPFVNYVREREAADVHILITLQRTGSGGGKYTIIFLGQNRFRNMSDTLEYISAKSESEDITRRGIVKVLKMGLIRYVARSPISDNIKILFSKKERKKIIDRWNHWIFSIGINGFFNGQQSKKIQSLYGNLSAKRVTEEWKTSFSIYSNYNSSNFKINDTTSISSYSVSYGSSVYIVKAINNHWSWGGWISAYSSSYSNMRIGAGLSPAIEYNIFPYSESAIKELRMLYSLGYKYNEYYEETIYDKFSEHLAHESISLDLGTTQKWGFINVSIEGSHYLNDFTKNRLSVYNNLSLHLIKGLRFTISGSVSIIHDQLSLPRRNLTPEEILLQRKEIATQYDYFGSIGFTYSFGSIYSNIVNPRFGR